MSLYSNNKNDKLIQKLKTVSIKERFKTEFIKQSFEIKVFNAYFQFNYSLHNYIGFNKNLPMQSL